MPQDSESGRRAAEFGRLTAEKVAALLGTKLLESSGSNMIHVDGERAVIKSAHRANPFIGITRVMLPKLDAAYAVLEKKDNVYEVYKVDQDFLNTRQKLPSSSGSRNQHFYAAREIRESGRLVATFDLPELRNYWVTTQWPQRLDRDINAAREGIYLPNGREEAGSALQPGDLVAIYEAKGGRTIVLHEKSGREDRRKCHTGRQGIVALLRVTSSLLESEDTEPETYTDGTELWWKWYAEAEPYSTSGFVPREELNRILGYAPKNPLKGFGDQKSGLKKISREVFELIVQAFESRGALPEMKPALRNAIFMRWGSGVEGPIHKAIKEAVAADPAGLLGEPGLRTIQMEYEFPTGDRADILLEDALGRIVGLEVEPAVGDTDFAGVLQAIKYRYMGALTRNKRLYDSRAILVAGSISPLMRKVCEAYEVECFVIDPLTLPKSAKAGN